MLKNQSQTVLDMVQAFARLFKVYRLALLCKVARLQGTELFHIVIRNIFTPDRWSLYYFSVANPIKYLTDDRIILNTNLYIVIYNVHFVREINILCLNMFIIIIINRQFMILLEFC